MIKVHNRNVSLTLYLESVSCVFVFLNVIDNRS